MSAATGTTAPGGAAYGDGDRYRFEARIAVGGMGEVWRATDTVLDREVAIKVLKAEYADDPTFRTRFESEARHAAALQHPNVASVFDFGELRDPDGSGTARPFLVMELVPGQPLSALLHGGEPMPPGNAADLVAQAADAIAAAHAMDVVHRDVKPANLMVTPDGEAKITDFGIARAAGTVALTQTGQIIGTPQYLSPEQAEGHPATAATDIYALGVVLYECLAGHRPFDADTPVTTALAHLREPVPPLPGDIPDHLRAVVAKALAKDPRDRFASAADLATALRGGPVGTVPAAVSAPGPVTRPLSHPVAAAPLAASPVTAGHGGDDDGRDGRGLPGWWPWAAAVVAVLVVVTGAVALSGGRDSEATTTRQTPSPGPETEPAEHLIRVRENALVGLPRAQAHRRLADLGLEVTDERQDNPGAHRRGTVAAVTPHGRLAPGTEITLFVWGAPPKEPAPEPDPAPPVEQPETGDHAGPGKDKPGKGHKGPSEAGKKHGKPKGKKR